MILTILYLNHYLYIFLCICAVIWQAIQLPNQSRTVDLLYHRDTGRLGHDTLLIIFVLSLSGIFENVVLFSIISPALLPKFLTNL